MYITLSELTHLGVEGGIRGIGQGGEGQLQVGTLDGYLHVYNIE